ncbi:MAG TPA: FUSC family protein [Planctomycetota bacterium]|nr:FUSC family protein [Planctomycetota bacterium]
MIRDVFNRVRKLARAGTVEFYEYNLKCFVGAAIGYGFYVAYPQHSRQFLWMLISILLSITYDNDSKVAFDRMKGNIIGSAVGLFVFVLHNPPNYATVCVGIALAIAICFMLKLIAVSRTTLVAFIIVLFYEEANSSWHGALYRMTSVIGGCLIGLVINYIFRKLVTAFHLPVSTPAQGAGKEVYHADKGGDE